MGYLEMSLVKSIGLLFTDFADKDHFPKMNSLLANVHADKISDMFLSLYECTYPNKSSTAVKAFSEKIYRLVVRRNKYLHSKWFFDDTQQTVYRIKFSMPAKKVADKDTGDAKALMQLISEIKKVNTDIVKFTLELMKESKK